MRVKAAFANKRALIGQGQRTLAPGLPSWIDQQQLPDGSVRFILNEHSKAVRRIFEMAAMGMEQRQIARRLREEGHPTPRDGTPGWHQPTISGILDNTAVTRAYRADTGNHDAPDAGEPVADYFPPVVDLDLYARAQRMRRQRPSAGRKGKTFGNLFTGLAACEHCSGPMAIKIGGSRLKPLKYLQCHNHQRRLGCAHGNRSFRYQDLEDGVLDTVREHAPMDIFHDETFERETAVANARNHEAADVIAGVLEDRKEWHSWPEHEQYAARLRVHKALRAFIDFMSFNSETEVVRVVIANGLEAYEFRHGSFLRKLDALEPGWTPL